MAEVDLNGRMEVVAIRLAAEAVDPNDLVLLQDLIKAAFTDASEKAREAIRIEMGAMTGGMGLPNGIPGF